MAPYGIGLKFNTLPLVELAVGISVDNGVYSYNRLEIHLN